MSTTEEWRTPEKRRAVIQTLEDAIRSCAGNPPPTSLQNPVDVEKAVYETAKSEEEYIIKIRRIILMIAKRRPQYQVVPSQQPLPPSSQLLPSGATQVPVSAPTMHGMPPGMGMGRPALQQPYQPSPYQQHQAIPPHMGHIPAPHPGQYNPSPHPATAMHPGMTTMHVPPAQRPMHPAGNMITMAAHPQGPTHYPIQSTHPAIQATAGYPPPPQPMYQVRHTPPLGPQMARAPMPMNMDLSMASRPGMMGMAGMQPQQAVQRFGYPGEGTTTGLQSVTAIPNPSFPGVSSAVRPPSVPPYAAPISNVPSQMVPGVPSPSPTPVPTSTAPITQEMTAQPLNTGTTSNVNNPPTPHPSQAPLQAAPSPAPPTPLLPASPITNMGSPAQPTVTPEENEAYLRKLGELQKYVPLMSRMMSNLSRTAPDERRNDQYLKLRSLYNLLHDTNRRVPLATLRICGESLERMFGERMFASYAKDHTDSPSAQTTPSTEPPLSFPSTTKLPEISRSQSLLEFKMIPSPPPTCNNLLETIQAKPIPSERLPPSKRRCNREEPLLSPGLKRELAHLEHFKIRQVSQNKNRFDKSTILECSLVDDGLPQVPSLTICIPPNYPLASPQVDLADYGNSSSLLKVVGKLLSDQLLRNHSSYTLSFLLTSWMECVMRATASELTTQE